MASLTLRLLGSPLIECDGTPIQVDTRKATALLAYLAVTARPHSREVIAALLWPEYEPTRARSALRRTLSTLRKALGERWLRIDRSSAALAFDDVWIDVQEFRRHLEGCGSPDHADGGACARCAECLSEALLLYRGSFLEGFGLRDSPEFEDWQLFEAEGLRREATGALETLVETRSALGQLDAATEAARRWLSLDPLSESAHRWLMQLYAWTGDRSAAMREYRECVAVLETELGVQPLAETTDLYQSILEGRAEAPAPIRLEAQAPAEDTPAGLTAPVNFPLVGREPELRALLGAYEALAGDGGLIAIEGEAGIGKTRLSEEFGSRVAKSGATVLRARCHEEESVLPYAAVVELLRSAWGLQDGGSLRGFQPDLLAEAARLVPDLGVGAGAPSPPPLDSPGAQKRFVDGVCRVLLAAVAGPVPSLLVVEDAHWADEASLDILAHLTRRLPGSRSFLVLTWRSENVPVGHRLRRLVTQMRRRGAATTILPGRLSLEDTRELVARTGRMQAEADELSRRLYEETEGLPFFLVEYLTTLATDPELLSGEGGRIPGGVQDMLRSRLEAVGESAYQMLTAAAVMGRSFDLGTLREASGRGEEEIVSAVEELTGLGLITETGAEAYDFCHEKMRSLVYGETSLARRRLLHRRTAEALARHRADPGPRAALVSYHYAHAGKDAESAGYAAIAGHYARGLFANSEALTHYRAALALGHPEPSPIYEAIADLLTFLGDYGGALANYEKAAVVADPASLARLEHKLGALHQRRGEWEAAETRFEAALGSLEGTGPDPLRARILSDRSLNAHRSGQAARAQELATAALAEAEAAGDPAAIAQAHNILGILASGRGDVAEASGHFERSLEGAGRLEDPSARIAALNNLALLRRSSGEHDEALRLAREAVELCAAQGDRHREAALHNNISDTLHACGRSEEAMAHLKQAVAIFAEVGEPQLMQPEIWKLVDW